LNHSKENESRRICLLGASFGTGNLGVGALAEASIKGLHSRWPASEIVLLGMAREPQQRELSIAGEAVRVKETPIRFSRNVLLAYHFIWFVLYGLLNKLLPNSKLKDRLISRNVHINCLYQSDLAADITGGDSFSDIYGMHRFTIGFLCKWLVLFWGKPLVLLPQTYGPYKHRLSRVMARYILKRAKAIYSRDQAGLEQIKNLQVRRKNMDRSKFAPDVAFILDSRKPKNFDKSPLSKIPAGTTLIGFNVNGLLFHGGYTQNNMFGLKADYRAAVVSAIEMLLSRSDVRIVLVPHVFPHASMKIESDPDACQAVYEQLNEKYGDKIVMPPDQYDQSEVKYIIGLCNFFVGSRMHSCIAAISQLIPTIGISYSRKFKGVFQSAGVEDCVVDPCESTVEEIVEKIKCATEQSEQIRERLSSRMPEVKESVLSMFRDMET